MKTNDPDPDAETNRLSCQFHEWQRETVKKFKDLMRKERKPITQFMFEVMADYVRLHHPGNPQAPLAKFTEEPKPEPETMKPWCATCHEHMGKPWGQLAAWQHKKDNPEHDVRNLNPEYEDRLGGG